MGPLESKSQICDITKSFLLFHNIKNQINFVILQIGFCHIKDHGYFVISQNRMGDIKKNKNELMISENRFCDINVTKYAGFYHVFA